MADGRLSNYDTAAAHLKAAENNGPQISDDGIVPAVQYELAAAQVRALLAVADELKALRKGVDGLGSSIRSLDEAPCSLYYIADYVKDIAERMPT